MNKQFTRKLFISIFTSLILLSTNSAFACVGNWTTVDNGNWSTDAIWSVNGGVPQVGPPPNNACITVNHAVILSGSYILGTEGELTIGITGNLIVQGPLTNNNIIVNSGQLTVDNTLTNAINSLIINIISGVININNDLINQDCSSVINNHGIINIGNSLYNGGTINGNGGMFNVTYDTKNTSCCAIFADNICVKDKDGVIENKCGIVEETVSQGVDCSFFLPIELLFFKAVAENNSILLTWSTASEINNDYFIIEKSLDSHNFIPVLELQGAGNSNQIKNYSVYDEKPIKGYSYYRLKQVDYDGKFSYSEIIVVDYNDVSSYLGLNYIPSSNTIKIQGEVQEGVLEIYSIQGQKVFSEKLISDKSFLQLSVKPKTGVYFVQLITNTKTIAKKLIIQ